MYNRIGYYNIIAFVNTDNDTINKVIQYKVIKSLGDKNI